MAHSFNWLAIGAAALVPLTLGAFWYSKTGFLSAWIKPAGPADGKQVPGHKPYIYIVSLALSFALAYFLSGHVTHGGEEFHTFKHGAYHGVRLGALVILPAFAINALFEGRNWMYIIIHVVYWLLCCTLMGGILGVWR